jgi:cytosine/uracil/thiamine/allantoin permease
MPGVLCLEGWMDGCVCLRLAGGVWQNLLLLLIGAAHVRVQYILDAYEYEVSYPVKF